MLVARELSATRGGKELFAGLSIQCAPGEIVALQGPSGSGKTTLLRILAGLDDPDQGAVTLEGKQGHQWGWPAYRRSICFVHQQAVIPAATVREVLRYPFTFAIAAEGEFDEVEAARLLEGLGLPGKMSSDASTLSQGEQQRVALVRALVTRPKVLLLDEPTSALDPSAREDVETLIRSRAAEGLSIIMVTHDTEQATRLCHRVLSINGQESQTEVTGG